MLCNDLQKYDTCQKLGSKTETFKKHQICSMLILDAFLSNNSSFYSHCGKYDFKTYTILLVYHFWINWLEVFMR